MSRARKPISKEVQISKTLSYLLRHGAVKEGVEITQDGYVKLSDILSYKAFKGRITKEEVFEVVNNCPKKRFAIKYEGNSEAAAAVASNADTQTVYLRANQGHSLNDVEVDLDEITDPNDVQNCIHGTYFRFWDSIKKQGLSKMGRQHVHFSEDFPNTGSVISGMRSSCQLAVFVDIAKAMNDGLKFYRSENNVILSPGDENGFIKPKYFSKAINIKTYEELDI